MSFDLLKFEAIMTTGILAAVTATMAPTVVKRVLCYGLVLSVIHRPNLNTLLYVPI